MTFLTEKCIIMVRPAFRLSSHLIASSFISIIILNAIVLHTIYNIITLSYEMFIFFYKFIEFILSLFTVINKINIYKI